MGEILFTSIVLYSQLILYQVTPTYYVICTWRFSSHRQILNSN